jgi:hypothetical protein
MSSTQSRSLVVSIHDVSPITWETTKSILADLQELGAIHCSLLVIPNHHHRGHFLENSGFCSWLRQRSESGDEIVIHGYFHQRERKPAESALQKMITRVYTQDEGEFYDIDEETAFDVVSRAQAEFRETGLNPSGFISPAWLLSAPAERALHRAGCSYTTRIGSVTDLRSNAIHPSQSMVYSVQNAWRRRASLAWNALLYRRLHTNPLLRIGIHPPDIKQPAIWRQIRHYLSLALEDRVPLTYEKWLHVQG